MEYSSLDSLWLWHGIWRTYHHFAKQISIFRYILIVITWLVISLGVWRNWDVSRWIWAVQELALVPWVPIRQGLGDVKTWPAWRGKHPTSVAACVNYTLGWFILGDPTSVLHQRYSKWSLLKSWREDPAWLGRSPTMPYNALHPFLNFLSGIPHHHTLIYLSICKRPGAREIVPEAWVAHGDSWERVCLVPGRLCRRMLWRSRVRRWSCGMNKIPALNTLTILTPRKRGDLDVPYILGLYGSSPDFRIEVLHRKVT